MYGEHDSYADIPISGDLLPKHSSFLATSCRHVSISITPPKKKKKKKLA